MSCNSLTIGATGLGVVDKLTNEQTGAYVNTVANMTGQVYEADRTTTIGSTFALSYVSSSNGKYTGAIPTTTTTQLTDGSTYHIKYTGTSSGFTYLDWVSVVAGY